MLTFLDNHDEQRIASPDFAGDPWKAVPAMVLSATMGKGPVLVFYGQEVGEPGAGIAGFSGEDGRTTIFDYWGVPEFQKWTNNGKFDGGNLSDEQKKLRGFYTEILRLVNDSKAISNGEFFDLHYYNRNDDFTGYSNKVYAYLRYNADEALLFLLNFNDMEETANIKIPQHAFDLMNLTASEVVIEDFYNWNKKYKFNRATLVNQSGEEGFSTTIQPHSYRIFKLR